MGEALRLASGALGSFSHLRLQFSTALPFAAGTDRFILLPKTVMLAS